MKIAYFGFDYFHACLGELVRLGMDVSHVYTIEVDGIYNFNHMLLSHAERGNASIDYFHSNTNIDWDALKGSGVNLIVAAGFPYRLPSEAEVGIKGINVHPSLLPEGRGPWPIPYYILKRRANFGVTIHKISETFDAGDILSQWTGEISSADDYDTISARLQLSAKELLVSTLNNFEHLWDQAKPQIGGTYWPKPTDEEQNLDFNNSVEENLLLSRAYGSAGVGAILDGREHVCSQVAGWKDKHAHPCGAIVHKAEGQFVVAVSDGFLLIRNLRKD